MANLDCAFYNERRCNVLTKMLCETGKCKFYKTKSQILEGLKKYPAIDYEKYRKTGKRVLIKVSESE